MTSAIEQSQTEILAVIAQLQTAHTDYPLLVELDNRKVVDQSTQTNPYLEIQIKYLTADQADMADHPRVEQWGQIWIHAVCKDGEGTAGVNKLRGFVTSYFDMKSLGLVKTKAVAMGDSKLINGLWKAPALVAFYYHRVSV